MPVRLPLTFAAVALLLTAASASSSSLAQAPDTTAPALPPPTTTTATGPADLPDALPSLDDDLVGAPAPPLVFFGQARVRGEVDDSRDFARADDTSAGTALTARVGIDATLGATGARLIVVVGDGGRIGAPPSAPALVPRAALPFLLHTELAFDVDVAGFPATFSLGRMPVVVADGRLVGDEPFDPRGRSLDGARLRLWAPLGQEAEGQQAPMGIELGAGGWWLGPGIVDDSDDSGLFSGLVVVDGAWHWRDDASVTLYGLLHRDGPAGFTVPTAGVRADVRALSFVSARAGGDLQAPVPDGNDLLSPDGSASHGELGVRLTAPTSAWLARADVPDAFLDMEAEVTAGDAVGGRVFRAPAPTQHGQLGLLDVFAFDNTWSAAAVVGAEDKDGLTFDLGARLIGVVDASGPLVDTSGRAITRRAGAGGVALVEIDARLELPLGEGLALGVGYGIGLPGPALVGDQPMQRFFVAVRADTSTSEDAHPPPPPVH